MKISILFATCGREELYRRALESLVDTVSDYDIEVVTVIDESSINPDTTQFVLDNKIQIPYIIDWCPNKRGALWAWNRALQISTGDILVPAGDDQIFHSNWLDYALESHQTKLSGYGVVGMNDLAYDGNIQVSTMWLFDRRWCKEQMGGIFAPPILKYYCVDSWWNDKAKSLGKFYWSEDSQVEHLHSAHSKRPVDNIDQEKMNADWMEEDNRIYAEWKNSGWPIPLSWKPMI